MACRMRPRTPRTAIALLVCLVAGMALLSAPRARADAAHPGKKATVSAGVYVPANLDVQDAFGPAWANLSASYDAPMGTVASHRFGLGFIQGTRRLESGLVDTYYGLGTYELRSRFVLVPLTYSLMIHPTGQDRGLYFGGGPGLYTGVSGRGVALLAVVPAGPAGGGRLRLARLERRAALREGPPRPPDLPLRG